MAVLTFPTPPSRDRDRLIDVSAGDVMSTAVIQANPEDDILEVAAEMLHARIRHVPVVGSRGVVTGIVSDRDVRTLLGEPREALLRIDPDVEPVPVERVMTPNPISARVTTPLREVARRLIQERIGAMPVADERGRLLGIVSWVDLLHHAFVS